MNTNNAQLISELTEISSFVSDHPLQDILDLLRRELDVPLVTLWKIKYGSDTMCAKARSSDTYSPDPSNKDCWSEYVCKISGHARKAIFSKKFQNHQPFAIDDIENDEPDEIFNTNERMQLIGTNSFVGFPIRSYKSKIRDTHIAENRPSYLLTIYFRTGKTFRDYESSHRYLFEAVANRISTTNSSKIEKAQIGIGASFNTISEKLATLSTEDIFGYVLHDLLPKHLSFLRGTVLWRSPGSHKFRVVSISPRSTMAFHLGQVDIEVLSELLKREAQITKIFDKDELHRLGLVALEKFNSLICAPLAPRIGEVEPNGYIILASKFSPFAAEVKDDAIIPDYFDWEDTILLDKVGETVGLVTELLNTDQRRKQLADQIAHEMLIPATTIFQDAEILFEEVDNPNIFDKRKRDRWLENIVQYSNLQMRLCDGILNSLKDDGTPPADKYRPGSKKIDLYKVATDIKYMVFPWCRKTGVRNDGIVINSDLPYLLIDKTAVEQVLLNLVSNSIKYAVRDYNRFSVKVSYEFVRSIDIPGDAGRSYRKEFGSISGCSQGHLITISDNGIGIPNDCEAKVFEKHFRAPGAEKVEARGSGLGLSIVKKIVDEHFGTCWVENTSNPTTLCVYFPRLLDDENYLTHPRWLGEWNA